MLALLVSAAATIAGMWMITTADLNVRRNRYLVRAAHCSWVASNGLQLAREQLGRNALWAGGSFSAPAHPGETFTVSSESLGTMIRRVQSVAAIGDSTQTVKADLRAAGHPSLEFNVCSASGIVLDNVTIGGALRANGSVSTVGDVDFLGVIETVANASVSNGIPSGQVRYATDVVQPPAVSLSKYASLSSSLVGVPTTGGSTLLLNRVALHSSSNPYGATNAKGAYVLDAGGNDVILRDVYLRGCLTILNSGQVLIERGFHAVREDPALATLVVQGNLDLRLESAMVEFYFIKDMNGDGDYFDTFPAYVRGLVHVTGALTGFYGGRLSGAAQANHVTLVGETDVDDDDTLLSLPVIEFTQAGPWVFVPGSISGS